MAEVDLDLLRIVAAATLAMVISAVWYAPPLIGNRWLALIERCREVLGDYGFEGRSWKLYPIDRGWQLPSLLAMGAILAY